MATADYSNGYIPDSMLVTFKTGWNSTDGNWKHQLSPGTYAKHLKLVALAKKRTGRALEISEGWGAYRPYSIQVLARKLYGYGAATPGQSSHGGIWFDGPRGQRTALAIDYGNWGWVYGWDRDAFYEDVRAAGLEPGLIHPSRGNNYPDEPWHAVDLDPWAPAPAGKSVSPATKQEEDEEEDMAMKGAAYPDGSKTIYILFNEVSGFYVEHSGVNGKTYNNPIAQNWDTGSWPTITKAHATVIKRSLDAVRRTAVTGSLSVDLSDLPQ